MKLDRIKNHSYVFSFLIIIIPCSFFLFFSCKSKATATSVSTTPATISGSVDSSFGNSGYTNTASAGYMVSSAVDSNGKIIVVGNVPTAVARYTTAGALDASFNSTGVLTVSGFAQLGAVAVQSDNKIILGGKDSNGFRLLRLNVDGTIDTNFGTSGVVSTNFSGLTGTIINAMAIQADGMIVTVGDGTGTSRNIAIARYTSAGILDTTFNSTGLYTNSTPGYSPGYGESVSIQSDNKILIGGQFRGKAAVTRFNTDGTIDRSIISTWLGMIWALKEQTDGKIVAAGHAIINGYTNMLVIKLLSDGSTFDTTFNSSGYKFIAAGVHNSYALGMAIQTDDSIILSGSSDIGEGTVSSPSHTNFTTIRLTPSGNLDTTFNNSGVLVYDYGYSSQLKSVFLSANGIIVVGGSGNTSFSLAKYFQ